MKTNFQLLLLATVGMAAVGLSGCCLFMPKTPATITSAPFGQTPDGTPVEIYTLRNSRGAEARIMTYGGIVQSLYVPDRNGKLGDVTLGYDNLQGYLDKTPYFGALIGFWLTATALVLDMKKAE